MSGGFAPARRRSPKSSEPAASFLIEDPGGFTEYANIVAAAEFAKIGGKAAGETLGAPPAGGGTSRACGQGAARNPALLSFRRSARRGTLLESRRAWRTRSGAHPRGGGRRGGDRGANATPGGNAPLGRGLPDHRGRKPLRLCRRSRPPSFTGDAARARASSGDRQVHAPRFQQGVGRRRAR